MVSRTDSQEPQIPKFYAGRSVFITGASGFMGLLLSTCPDIERLYLLLREKKNSSPLQRLQQLKESMIFEKLREKSPSQLDKLSVVSGDTTLPRLGLDNTSVQQLRDVSVVFFSAAMVKFEEPLSVAVNQNLKPVIEALALCDTLSNLEAFIYVSTAYSNADQPLIEERVYPPPAPLQELLTMVDTYTPEQLEAITPKYISPKLNTYTFSKAMAEAVINDHTERNYSIAIFRPTIVVSSISVPYPGWVQSMNGPSSAIVAAGKGLMHVQLARGDACPDLLPVDLAIHALIAVGWSTVRDRSREVLVYNCSTGENPITWQQFADTALRALRSHPLDRAFYWPCGDLTHYRHRYLFKVFEFLLNTLPLYVAHYFKMIFGIKSKINLISVSKQLQNINLILSLFSMNEWRFKSDNMRRLRESLSRADAQIYNLDPNTIRWDEHVKNYVKGVRKYVLKEKDEDLPKARRRLRMLHLVHQTLLVIFFFLLFRFALKSVYIYNLVRGVGRLLISFFI
ncbi:unnamed protein product [Chilo suppressalis]|uniref:Fatty acyl-CoA reductase n=1 Tax=Chilo suppressalis TaxID=168631 RepID=A0ABN8BDD1_CHISP|nr:unnamed protein product [Chilo suppressalis]